MSEETINALPVHNWTSDDWEEVQQRAVNPFRANEARAVNRLTRILTKGEDAILTQRNIEFIDGTTLRIYKGSYIKDDVYVEFTEDLDLDFTDEDNYYSDSYRGMTGAGTYWVALVYTFINSIPNPYATFKIIKREEDISENTLIVVKLEVKEDEENPGSFVIDEDSLDTSDCANLYTDALNIDLETELSQRACVFYDEEHENIDFTHAAPAQHTTIGELDAKVQNLSMTVTEATQKVAALETSVETLQTKVDQDAIRIETLENEVTALKQAVGYDDLYGTGKPLADLADYPPVPNPDDDEPEVEPEEPGEDEEPEQGPEQGPEDGPEEPENEPEEEPEPEQSPEVEPGE